MRGTRTSMHQREEQRFFCGPLHSTRVLSPQPPSPPRLVTHSVPGRCPVVRPTPVEEVSTSPPPAPRS